MKEKDYALHRSHSEPGPGDGGNTGSWRVEYPVIDESKCIPAKKKTRGCFLCWLHCPDGVIFQTIPPSVDLQYCKGCGICAEECPAGAITMVAESERKEE